MTRCLLTSIGGHRVYFIDRVFNMPIIRSSQPISDETHFAVPGRYIEDTRLSLTAKGVLVCLCSFPAGTIIKREMLVRPKNGITSINTALKELLRFELVKITKGRIELT